MKGTLPILALLLIVTMAVRGNNTPDISVGGLSSGAFFAVQMHYAHSATIKGAAVFAGGPFYCAQGQVTTALTVCMSIGTGINEFGIKNQISTWEKSGLIDDSSNLADSRVFIFSGKSDYTVNPKVNMINEKIYSEYKANILSDYTMAAGHTMPTEDYGVACASTGSPFIGKCDFYGAWKSLQHLHPGKVEKAPAAYNKANLFKYRQTGGPAATMDENSYVYIPQACQKTISDCPLHVVFHGCKQTLKDIGTQYVENTGYNEVAEGNNLVILYPQAVSSLLKNPNGCWDWWGYNDKNYANKNGGQISVTYNMILDLLKGEPGLEQVYPSSSVVENIVKNLSE